MAEVAEELEVVGNKNICYNRNSLFAFFIDREINMKGNSALFALSPISLLLLSTSYAAPVQNPCDSIQNNDAVHCAYIGAMSQPVSGKYIKIKEIQSGKPASTHIFCTAPSKSPLKVIPQNLWSKKDAQNITWQFSQCMDEDCVTSKLLADDKFTVTKQGKVFTSGPKNRTEIVLDPNYGVNCDVKKADKPIAYDSALNMRIEDAVAMIEAIPVVLAQTGNILTEMTSIAEDVANGGYSPSQMLNLDNQFQTLKDELDKVQRINTLDGYKKVSLGSLFIQFGYSGYEVLQIPIPATDKYYLDVAYLDVTNEYNATYAVPTLINALDVVTHAQSLKAIATKKK